MDIRETRSDSMECNGLAQNSFHLSNFEYTVLKFWASYIQII
jgi:hypothetical protein